MEEFRPIVGGLALAMLSVAAWADGASLSLPVGSARIERSVLSFVAMRDANVVRQQRDYSCGAASLATLIHYGLDDPVEEAWFLDKLLAPLTKEELIELQKRGLSLLDMQRLARERGHRAQGFRIHRDELVKLVRPVIVHIRPKGYQHFAVLRGIRGDRAYLADPSQGNLRMPLYRFYEMWADADGVGTVFVVERTDGRWPAHYPLALPGALPDRIEATSARRFFDSGAALPALIR